MKAELTWGPMQDTWTFKTQLPLILTVLVCQYNSCLERCFWLQSACENIIYKSLSLWFSFEELELNQFIHSFIHSLRRLGSSASVNSEHHGFIQQCFSKEQNTWLYFGPRREIFYSDLVLSKFSFYFSEVVKFSNSELGYLAKKMLPCTGMTIDDDKL